MTATDVPACPTVVGWSARRHVTREGIGCTIFRPVNEDGNALDVWVFDGPDGLVEIGSYDFRTRAECLSLAELLTAVLR